MPPGSGGMPPGSGGTPGRTPIDPSFLSPDGLSFVKEPPGDKPVGPDAPTADYCFNIVAHNAQTPLATDTTPFNVKASEFYHAFQFKVPYTKPAWALSTRPIIDNNKVLHHWLLFQMGGAGTDGSHADEVGLQLGNAMLTGWAPGGNPLDMPESVGLEMPKPGGFVLIENHYNNVTGSAQKDRSGVRMCVTYTPPKNPASLTWLGTETIGVPANKQGTATGTCATWKKNTDVHIIQTVPHMHRIGKHMKTVINRGGGATQDIVVDKPFTFTDQRAYAVDLVVKPTDTLTTTCTFENDTNAQVTFGTATAAEMCYNFVIYYPAHALDGAGGIEGSANMCLR
jgi:dopamine beta-monooxygenase